jgi:anti-sigma B factor antagonist
MTTSGQEAGGGAPWTVSDTKNLVIQGELAGGALVAKASGRVDGGNAKDFQEALETMLKDNVNTFVLNMENLSYISSAGLRVILLVAKQLQGKSAKFGMCSLSESSSEVFQISGFDKIIPTHATQAEAISSLGA